MRKICQIVVFFIFYFLPLSAENIIEGMVIDEKEEPVAGANVHWSGTQTGTSTDNKGLFRLKINSSSKKLIASFVGYLNDTIEVENSKIPVKIQLKEQILLQEVVISRRPPSTITSRLSVIQTLKITDDELRRAACCNLAESFETNPSVDVSYTDAASGAKQIRLLGLAGTYVQMLTENFPNFRGGAIPYGLDYTPGPWMESIYVSKGTSSVKNGYEAITGQINVELKKPRANSDIFSANVFAGDNGRYEFNADGTAILNTHLSSTLLAHFSSEEKEFDMNDDGFLDVPLKRQVNLMNRWEYKKDRFISQFGVRFLNENRKGGQTDQAIAPQDSLYRINLKTNRVEFFAKNGLIPDAEKNQSVAFIFSGSYHEQQSSYGFRPYNLYETNLYGTLLFEKDLSDSHKISTGLSLNYDRFNENYFTAVHVFPETPQIFAQTEEVVTGGYFEYTYNLNDKLIVLAGIRSDYSNLYEWFVTPRLHLKYNFTEWMHLRASAGKGYRSAHVLAENNFYLASSREIHIAEDLDMEEAWNYGANLSFYIPIAGKELTLNTEYYYTNFRKQVVVDMESDPHQVNFYNLNGDSYASNFQVEATYPFFRGFTLTAAYRIMDVKTTYHGVLKEKPFTNDYKALITASYQTPLRKWQFDATAQFSGGGQMPTPDTVDPKWDDRFGPFTVFNAQITKFFRTWSVYAGVENLFDFTQKNPIIEPENPYGTNFDTSLIWGPLHGRTIYVGLRYNMPRI